MKDYDPLELYDPWDEYAERKTMTETKPAYEDFDDSIVRKPWEWACNWYDVDIIHQRIRAPLTGEKVDVPKDIESLEFASWLANQLRLAMCKGAELATQEMQEMPCVHELVKRHSENMTTD